jgi:hypothetical protein
MFLRKKADWARILRGIGVYLGLSRQVLKSWKQDLGRGRRWALVRRPQVVRERVRRVFLVLCLERCEGMRGLDPRGFVALEEAGLELGLVDFVVALGWETILLLFVVEAAVVGLVAVPAVQRMDCLDRMVEPVDYPEVVLVIDHKEDLAAARSAGFGLGVVVA